MSSTLHCGVETSSLRGRGFGSTLSIDAFEAVGTICVCSAAIELSSEALAIVTLEVVVARRVSIARSMELTYTDVVTVADEGTDARQGCAALAESGYNGSLIGVVVCWCGSGGIVWSSRAHVEIVVCPSSDENEEDDDDENDCDDGSRMALLLGRRRTRREGLWRGLRRDLFISRGRLVPRLPHRWIRRRTYQAESPTHVRFVPL